MASTWEIISSTFLLFTFLWVVFLFVKISGALSQSTTATRSSLSSRGVTYQDGKLSVKTDVAPPSRDEYIAQTRRALEQGARTVTQHPGAFKTGPSGEESTEKKGFRRTKKLA